MITAYYSTILRHPVERVWATIRDFNSYPDYIDGVVESIIEDDRRSDEVGAVRRFNYRGHWIRQKLVRHSDKDRLLTYAGIEPLPFPPGHASDPPAPVGYEGTLHLLPVIDNGCTFLEWPVALDAAPGDETAWHALFLAWIPEWAESLRRTLDRQAPPLPGPIC